MAHANLWTVFADTVARFGERTAVEWFRATLSRKNAVVASNPDAAPEKAAAPAPRPSVSPVQPQHIPASPAPVAAQPRKANGRAAAGFKAALLLKRDYYIEKAARLEEFAAKIGIEDDEVLTEVFRDLMGGQE